MKNRILKQIAAFATALTISLGIFTLFPEVSFPQISFPVFAESTIVESGQCGDNVFYELDSEGTLTIFGTGNMYNDGASYTKESIKKVIIENGVESIGDNAANLYFQIYNFLHL